MNRFRRILMRWEKKAANYLGLLHPWLGAVATAGLCHYYVPRCRVTRIGPKHQDGHRRQTLLPASSEGMTHQEFYM